MTELLSRAVCVAALVYFLIAIWCEVRGYIKRMEATSKLKEAAEKLNKLAEDEKRRNQE